MSDLEQAASRWELIEESRKESQRFAQVLRRQLLKFTTSAYGGMSVATADDPENYFYAYVANASARNLIADPSAHLATDIEEAAPRIVELQDGLNNWYVDTRYRTIRERFLVDMAFGFCVSCTTQEARPGYESYGSDAVQTPRMYRVPPPLFGWDTVASHFSECDFMHHACVKKIAWLKTRNASEGWDMEAISKLEDVGVSQVREKQGLKRGEVVYFEFWDKHERLPDSNPAWADIPKEKRDLYHGTIHTIALVGGTGKEHARELRAPRPFFGPECGPYRMGGYLVVPDQVVPLSALTANEPQFIALNNQARRNDRAARLSKDIIVVDAAMPNAKAAVIDAVDGDVLGIPGFDPTRVSQLTLGGAKDMSLQREQWLRDRADRGVGTSPFAKGEALGDATLGENLLAAGAIETLAGLFDSKFAQFEAESALNVLWYLHNDDRSVTRANGQVFLSGSGDKDLSRAISQGVMPEPQSEEELTRVEDPHFKFDDLNVRIETLRMDGTEEQRLTQVGNLLLQWTPLYMQGVSQFADLQPYWKRAALIYKWPELARMFDQEAAAEFAQAAAEAAMAPAQPKTVPAPQRPTGAQAASKTAKPPQKQKVTNAE